MRAALLIAVGLMIGTGAGSGKGAVAQATVPRLNLVVVCLKCIPEEMPQESYNAGNILLDQNTGNLWFYPSLGAGVKPRLLGTLTALGQPVSKPQQ